MLKEKKLNAELTLIEEYGGGLRTEFVCRYPAEIAEEYGTPSVRLAISIQEGLSEPDSNLAKMSGVDYRAGIKDQATGSDKASSMRPEKLELIRILRFIYDCVAPVANMTAARSKEYPYDCMMRASKENKAFVYRVKFPEFTFETK